MPKSGTRQSRGITRKTRLLSPTDVALMHSLTTFKDPCACSLLWSLGLCLSQRSWKISAMLRGVDLWGSFDYLQIHFPVHRVASRRLGNGPRAYSQPCRSTGARKGLKYAASLRRPHQALKEHQNSMGTELETPETHRSLPVASWGSYLSSGDRRICCEKGTVGKV